MEKQAGQLRSSVSGGVWIWPEHGERVKDTLYFAAYAYPTHSDDPPIDHVNFTIGWYGYWQVACVAYPPVSGSLYSGEVNLRQFGLSFDKSERIQVSFDVFDREGGANFAPHGVRTITMVRTDKPSDPASGLNTDILLITVTTVEAQAVLRIFEQETGKPFQRHFIGDKTYFELGTVNGARVVMVQSEMGAGGPGGALIVVDEGIRVLSPSAVIMVGIAFGIDDEKQHIGDILVSEQLLAYEVQRVATDKNAPASETKIDIILQGDRPRASTKLLDHFRGGMLDWDGPEAKCGLILSGDKLVDNRAFRDGLRKQAPKAIGGEMEGTGLYAAAQHSKVDWILVKAICDWADGNKGDDSQQLAAENAARFTLHVLKQGGFVRNSTSTSASSTTQKKESSSDARIRGTLLCQYNVHASYVVAVSWEPDGTRIASAGGDGTVRVWESETGESLLTYHGHTGLLNKINLQATIYTVAWAPEGLRIASAGDGTRVYVWNAATGQTLTLYEGHSGMLPNVFAVAWSLDGKQMVSACSSIGLDKTIHLWNASTGQTIGRYDAHYGLLPNFSVSSLAWSPDGTRLAAACGDKVIRVWSVATQQLVAIYHFHAQWASHIAWSPDSRYLASAHSDHTALLWDTAQGINIMTYREHTDSVRYVAWSPDGMSLATASNDRTVCIWEALTGKHVYTYRGHAHWVTSVAWSPDGARIASGSNDKTVHIWQAEDNR